MEYIIKAKVPVNGKHWELEFHRGVSQTEDKVLAQKYKQRGYEVTPKRKKGDKA